MSDFEGYDAGISRARASACVTHHYACDCREWERQELVARLAKAMALLGSYGVPRNLIPSLWEQEVYKLVADFKPQ